MITIFLIRHGQKISEMGDPGLTAIGVEQAIQTGKYLSQFPISKVISSPFQRTVETAKNISDELQLDFSQDDRLVERMNWDDPSVTRKQFLQEWVKSTNDREYLPKYGDSSRATGERVNSLIEELLLEGKDQYIVLVTHGGAILDYLRSTFGDERIAVLKTQYQLGVDFQMMNCSINKIVFDDQPTLVLLNDTKHLTERSE